jgi:hypothetical protein
VNGEAVPHQATESVFPKLHTTRQLLFNMLLAYQVEYKLPRVQGAQYQLPCPDFSAIGEADACGGSILYDDLSYITMGVELATAPYQNLMGSMS